MKVKLEKAAPSKTTAAGKEAEAKPDQKVETDDLYGANGGETWRTWYTTKGTVKNLQDFKEIEVAIPVKAGQTAFSVGLLLTDDSGGEYLQKITIPAAAAKKGGMYTVRIPVKTLKGMKGISEAHFGEGTGLQGKYNPANKLILNKDNDEKFDNQNLGNPEIRLFKKSSGARMAEQRISPVFLPYQDFEKAQRRLFEVAFPGRAYDPGMPYDVPVTSGNGNTFSAPQRISYIYDLAFLNSEIRRLSPAEDLYAKTVFLFVVIPYRVAANIFLTLFDSIMSFIPGRSGARMASIPDLEKENVWNIVDLGQYILQAKSIIYREDRSLPEDVTARVYVVTGERQDVTVSVQTEASGLIRAVSIQKRWLPSSITLPEQTFKDYPDSSLKSIERDLRTKLRKQTDAIAVNMPGTSLRFVNVVVPDNFAPHLNRHPYDLVTQEISVASLDNTAEASLEVLKDPLAQLVVSGSVGQAISSVMLAGKGKSIKELADAQAMHFTERIIQDQVERHRDTAVVVLADEGSKDGSFSLAPGSIYIYDEAEQVVKEYKYSTFSHLREQMIELRTRGITILKFAGDGLDNTNGFVPAESAFKPGNSMALFSLFVEDRQNAETWLDGEHLHLIDDNFRLGGVSYSSPADAGVEPFDLPGAALEKIIAARAVARGIDPEGADYREFHDEFMNHTTVLTLGPRDASVAKANEKGGLKPHRHQRIMDDAENLKKLYPGLNIVKPGDGDLLPRAMAMIGADLDGRHLVVFGRSGAPEAVSTTIISANRPQAQHSYTLASEKPTTNDFSAEKAHAFTDDDRELFQHYNVSESAATAVRKKRPVTDRGVFAITSVTGASEDIYGADFSRNFDRVQFIPDAQGEGGSVVTSTLLVHPTGSFLVKTRFRTSNLLHTKAGILGASGPVRHRIDQLTGYMRTRLQGENLINLEDAVSDYHSGNIENAADYLNRINVADDDAETLSGLNELKLFTTAAAARLAAQAQQTTAKIPAIDDIRLFGQQRVEGINVALPSEIRVAVDGRLIKLVFSEIPNTPPPGGAGAGPRSIVRYASTEPAFAIRLSVDKEGSLRSLVRLGENDPLDMETSNTLRTPVGAVLKGLFEGAVEDNQNLNQLAGARAAVPGFVELEKMIETAVAVRRTETSADTIQYELTGLFEKRNVTIGFAGQAPTGRIADKITVASGLSQEPAQTIQRDSINAANFDSLAAQLEKNAVLKGPIADVAGLNQFFGAALAVRTLSVANNLIQYEAVISIGSNGSYTSRRINLSFVQRQEAWIPAQFAVLAAPGTKEVSQVIARNPSNQKDFDALTVRFMGGNRDFGSDAGAQAGITRDDLLSYLQAATPDFQFTVPAGRAPSYRFILPNNVRNRIIRWRYIVYPPVVIPTFNLDTLVLNLVPIQADEHTVNVIVVKTDRTQPIFSAIKELTAAAAARLPGVAQQDTNPLGPNREILTVRVRSIGNNDFTVTVSLAKNPPLIRKDIHIENFEPETLAQAIAIQFNRQFSATAVEEINARLETEIENAIGSLVVPVEPVEPVAKSPVVSVPVPGTGKKTFHQPTIDEINRAQGNVDVEALQREMDQLSKTDTLSIQNQRRFFEGLATEAAKEPNPVTVTLNVLQANGQIGTDTIVLPASKIELLAAGREGLISRLEYHLAALFNIRGVINGGTEVHITSSNETVLPAGSLLVNVKRILETEFGNTLTFASFGSKEGVLFKNEPLVAENRHGVTGLSAEPVDFNQPGIGFDLGGTNIKIARRDNTGEESKLTLTSKSLAELASEGALAQFIEAQILATPAAVPASGEVRYVVITIPGPVTPLGKIVNITNLEVSRRGTQAELEKLQQDLEQKGIHLIFQNDANAAAFYYQTAHSIAGNVIVNTLGTGVGHAVIKNGRLGEGPMEAHIRYTLNPNAEFHQGFGIKGDLESIANAAFVVSEATHFLIEAELDVPDNLTAETVGQWLVTPPSDNPEKHRQIAETVFRQVGRNLFILHQETARVNDEKEWTVVLFGGIAQGASAQEIIKGIQEASSGSDITLRNIIAIPEAASAGAIGALNLGLQANQYAVSAARLATAESPLLVESAAQELRVNTGFGQSSNISDTTLNPVVAGARLVEAHHSSLQLNRQEVFDILKTAQLPNDELPSFLEFSLTALPDGVEVVSADVPAALPFAPARFSKPLVFYPGVTRLLQRRGSVSLAQVETVAALANAEAILAGQFPALLGKKSGAWNNLMKEQPTNAGALKDVEIFLTADIMKNVADLRQALQKADLVSRSRGVNVILNILTRTEGLTEAEADLVASELKTLNNPRLGITTDGRLAQGQTLYDFALGKLSQQRNGLTNLQQGATNLVLIANSGNKDEILRQVGNTGGIYQNSIFAAGADLPPADQSGLASYSLAEMIATSLYQAMGLQSMISENLGLKVIVDPNTGFRYYIFKFNIGKELANLRLSKLAEIAA